MEQHEDTGIGRREFVTHGRRCREHHHPEAEPRVRHAGELRRAPGPARQRRARAGRRQFLPEAHRRRRHGRRRPVRRPARSRARSGWTRPPAENGKPAVPDANYFKGPKAYEAVFGSKDVDAVVIATPVFLHPAHCEAALAAGKHVYLEKPVAVDVPGCKKVMDLGPVATAKKLSLAIGLQLRHASPYVELARRMHEGECGAMVCGQTHYFASALTRPEWPDSRSGAAELGARQGAVRRHHRRAERPHHRHDELAAEGPPGEGRRDAAGARAAPTRVTRRATSTSCTPTRATSTSAWPRRSSASPRGASRCSTTAPRAAPRRATTRPCASPARPSGSSPGLGRPPETEQAAAATGAFRGALEDADANKEKAFIESITERRAR